MMVTGSTSLLGEPPRSQLMLLMSSMLPPVPRCWGQGVSQYALFAPRLQSQLGKIYSDTCQAPVVACVICNLYHIQLEA